MNPTILRFWGPGFLNQVPTVSLHGVLWGSIKGSFMGSFKGSSKGTMEFYDKVPSKGATVGP